ncbi:MAG: flagellar biogenesis protein FliO [Rhodothermales bacterium]|jgi:flagellar biogenesis protein FliO
MRTNFPPTEAGSSAKESLRRALMLSVLLVIVWSAIAFLSDSEPPTAAATQQTEQSASSLPTQTPGVSPEGELLAATAGATEALADFKVPVDSGLLAPAARSLFGPGYMLVLALLGIAGTWALWLKNKKSTDSSAAQLTELGRFKLGPQQQVQLLRCADEVLLLGVANGSINLLKAYPAAEFPSTVIQATSERPSLRTTLIELASSFRASHTARRAEKEAIAHDDDWLPAHPAKEDFPPGVEIPEWTIATASAISDGPDFMHVLRRYAGNKTYKANTLYPPTGATN